MSCCQGMFQLPDEERGIQVECGTTITDAAILADIVLDVRCGYKGTCGGCLVELVEGTFRVGKETIRPQSRDQRRRVLGCQTTIQDGPWRIAVPKRSLVETGEQIEAAFEIRTPYELQPTVRKLYLEMDAPTLDDATPDIERITRSLTEQHGLAEPAPSLGVMRSVVSAVRQGGYKVTVTLADVNGCPRLMYVEPGDTTGRLFGIAVDIGTTTVVLNLVDLTTGQLIGTASSYNQQVARADDVAARISYCHPGPEAVADLHRLIIDETINRLARSLCLKQDVSPNEVARMAISGNTTMTLLALGISPEPVGVLPFQPATNRPSSCPASQLGVAINPEAVVDFVPGFHGYVGGDITSDILVSGMADDDATAMMIDIGTNGEIAVGSRAELVACACAAGPAFEGGQVAFGMRASGGAIEAVTLDRDTFQADCQVIGEIPPFGICGSGLIDFLAEGLRVGLIGPAGRFTPNVDECSLLEKGTDEHGRPVIRYTLVPAAQTENGTGAITVSEGDIQQLLPAKAAIFSGVRLLLESVGKTFEDLETIYLAGGFARHINLQNAVAIGLLPPVPLERFRVLGNGSLAGAYLRLTDGRTAERMSQLASRPKVIELNQHPKFMDEFTNALFLPHMDPSLFPSVS